MTGRGGCRGRWGGRPIVSARRGRGCGRSCRGRWSRRTIVRLDTGEIHFGGCGVRVIGRKFRVGIHRYRDLTQTSGVNRAADAAVIGTVALVLRLLWPLELALLLNIVGLHSFPLAPVIGLRLNRRACEQHRENEKWK